MSGTEQAGMELRAQFFHRIRPLSIINAMNQGTRFYCVTILSRALFGIAWGKNDTTIGSYNREPQLLTAMVVYFYTHSY